MKHLNIDTSHSAVHFTVRHLVVSKVRGVFGKFSGTIDLDTDNIENSSVAVQIDAASIDTREPKRDDHLRSADFFEVEKFPTLDFKSTSVKKQGDDLAVTGDLTIHGVTKSVVLEVEQLGASKDPWGNHRVAWSAKTEISRKDFGLTWNMVLEAGGVAVSDKIVIELDVQAV
jgi:polyisoprenoid-binding protein YceI